MVSKYLDAKVECSKCDFVIVIKECVKRIGQDSYALNENYLNNLLLREHLETEKHYEMSVSPID